MTTDAEAPMALGATPCADECMASKWAVRSRRGSRRDENEDRYLAAGQVFTVCDGVGGGPDGALAAEITIAALGAATRSREVRPLAAVLEEANRQVRARSAPFPTRAPMATTATAIRLDNGKIELAHVGDSRAYLFRGGVLRRLTRDHTLVAELVRAGAIPAERSHSHPLRGMIVRAIGLDRELRADYLRLGSRRGDAILLASDGLTDRVSDQVIAEILGSGRDIEDLVEALADRARGAGSGDDITVVVVGVCGAPVRPRTAVGDGRERQPSTDELAA